MTRTFFDFPKRFELSGVDCSCFFLRFAELFKFFDYFGGQVMGPEGVDFMIWPLQLTKAVNALSFDIILARPH